MISLRGDQTLFQIIPIIHSACSSGLGKFSSKSR
jgi:hypothetical protein